MTQQWFYPSPVPITPQLYAHVDAKLSRIQNHLYTHLWYLVKAEGGSTIPLTVAYLDIGRCRNDLKYEYLGLKDSWL